MANYNPPTEDITGFNTSLFNQPEDTLSQAEADKLYLSKTKNDISTASSTTFNGEVNVGGTLIAKTNLLMNTWGNKIGNEITLLFPLEEVNTIAPSSGTSMILNLPTVTSNERGMSFTFIKTYASQFNVTIIANNNIFPSNGSGSTTNTTLLASDKSRLTLGVGFQGGSNYWMELNNYSLFDRDQNNLNYARLSQANLFTQAATFNGGVNVGGTLTGSSLIQSNTTSATTNKLFDNLFSGSTLAIGTSTSTNTISGTTTFNQTLIANLNSNTINGNGNTGLKNLFTALTGTLNIGQATTSLINLKGPTTFDLNTTFSQNVTIGTDGVSNDLSVKGEQRFYDTLSPYTSYAKISNLLTTSVPSVVYESPNVPSSSHIFKCYNSGGTLTTSLFDVTPTSVISRTTLTLVNRLNFSSATSYTFPFTSNTSLGYYLKATGTGNAVTSATPKTILTTASIPIGVWRIDFSVQNTVNAGGTITQEQNYVSNTLNGAISTAVPFTGSINRAHVNEVYATNDEQVITSSFTYNQSTAGVLYLNIVRTFTGGAYSFIGEIAITRLA